MRTGMIALALGLVVLRFLPALPPTWLVLLMPILALMLLPFRTIHWHCFCSASRGRVFRRSGR